ncbi:hypothetical protein [Streptomyces sp.]|uniref:hypothetical protein n=1 Tax=Streptomyces sp. TaxID=1931 RepID=UPI002D764A86|nr:hypothetical protein [Streptomyces sp.]HET6359076.1 hypothetical protein [Streptomyces sp.]
MGAVRAIRTARAPARLLAGRTGTWRGRPTTWHKTFANGCEPDAATGDLFRV